MIKVDLLRCISTNTEENTYFFKDISSQNLCEIIEMKSNYWLLDVRDNESYVCGHVKTAVHFNCSTNLMTKKSILKLRNEMETVDQIPDIIIFYNYRNTNFNPKLISFLSSWSKKKSIYTLKGGFEKFIDNAPEKYIVRRNTEILVQLNQVSSTNYMAKSEDIMMEHMSKITDFIFIGNEHDSSDLDLLKSHGITHIMCITSNTKLHFIDQQQFIYYRIPALDSSKQDLMKFFEESSNFIEKVRICRGRVLVHCLAGVSRSVTIVSAYFIKFWKMNVLDALDYIRERRSIAAPNFSFIGQLERYSKTL